MIASLRQDVAQFRYDGTRTSPVNDAAQGPNHILSAALQFQIDPHHTDCSFSPPTGWSCLPAVCGPFHRPCHDRKERRCPRPMGYTHVNRRPECTIVTTPSQTVEIYCVKCKAKTASRDIEAVTMKNGRPATRAVCVDCGTRKFRIGVLP